jgi:hypothetical protein
MELSKLEMKMRLLLSQTLEELFAKRILNYDRLEEIAKKTRLSKETIITTKCSYTVRGLRDLFNLKPTNQRMLMFLIFMVMIKLIMGFFSLRSSVLALLAHFSLRSSVLALLAHFSSIIKVG